MKSLFDLESLMVKAKKALSAAYEKKIRVAIKRIAPMAIVKVKVHDDMRSICIEGVDQETVNKAMASLKMCCE